MKKFNILVSRRRGGLGDQICCTVAVRAAREKYPDDHLTFRTNGQCHALFFDQKYCDEVISGTGTREYQFMIDLDGPEWRYDKRVQWDIKKSRIQLWCEAADHIPDDMCPHWTPTQKELRAAISALEHEGITPFQFIMFQWQSARPYKDIPTKQRKEIVFALLDAGHRVVVVHDTDAVGKDVQERADVMLRVPIREVATFTSLAGMVIAPDSGFIHLAAAVDTPCLGLFGPTDPRTTLRHYPYANSLWTVDPAADRLPHFSCAKPCWGNDVRHWPQVGCSDAHSKCMAMFTTKEIVDASAQMMDAMSSHNMDRWATLEGRPIIRQMLDPQQSHEFVNTMVDAKMDCVNVREPVVAQRKPR